MKFLIITGIFPPDIGGPATYVPQIATALTSRGHQITVVTLSDRLDHDDTKYPFRVVRLPRRTFKPWRWLRTMVKLIRLGRNAEMLFVNGLAMEAVLANLLLRKPMVQKVVGDLAWERSTNQGWVRENFEEFQKRHYNLKVEALKALRRWWTRKADKVIVPSRYLAHWIANWGVPEGRIVVIYNALESLNSIHPAEIPLPTSLKVVTVGRLIPWKRIDKLMEAVAILEGVGLAVIGDGPEQGRLEALAFDLGIAERVYFAGAKSKEETLALMAACDIFVLNSTYEGFPHVLLEAMSLGLPVIATAVGGTPEIVRNGYNGILVELEDDKLNKALERLLEDKMLRINLASNARLTVKEFFNSESMVKKTETVLINLKRNHN